MNSQPSLNAAESSDKVHGWGPKNGYVYQKQYLEFFCHKDVLPKLLDRIDSFNNKSGENSPSIISYYAVNKSGNLQSNCNEDEVNAVTWGVFPGEENLQPTIVERTFFLAWEDEVYRLFTEWIKIFNSNILYIAKDESESFTRFISDFSDNFVLCNLVTNDYIDENQTIFRLIDDLQIPDLSD